MTETDLAGLPGPVQSCLWFMGVVGRPRDWSFQARFAGRFRMRPGARWMPAEAGGPTGVAHISTRGPAGWER